MHSLAATPPPAIAVGVDVALSKAAALPQVTLLPTLVLAVGLLVATREGDRLAALPRWKRGLAIAGLTVALAVTAPVLAAVGGAATGTASIAEGLREAVAATGFLSTYGGSQSLVGAAGAVGVQYLLVSGDPGRRWVDRGTVLAGGVALALAVPLVGVDGWPAGAFARAVGLVVPLAWLPLARSDDRRERALLAAVVLAGPALLAVGFGPFGGFGERFGPVVFVPWALVTGAVGLAGYVAGTALAGKESGAARQ